MRYSPAHGIYPHATCPAGSNSDAARPLQTQTPTPSGLIGRDECSGKRCGNVCQGAAGIPRHFSPPLVGQIEGLAQAFIPILRRLALLKKSNLLIATVLPAHNYSELWICLTEINKGRAIERFGGPAHPQPILFAPFDPQGQAKSASDPQRPRSPRPQRPRKPLKPRNLEPSTSPRATQPRALNGPREPFSLEPNEANRRQGLNGATRDPAAAPRHSPGTPTPTPCTSRTKSQGISAGRRKMLAKHGLARRHLVTTRARLKAFFVYRAAARALIQELARMRKVDAYRAVFLNIALIAAHAATRAQRLPLRGIPPVHAKRLNKGDHL